MWPGLAAILIPVAVVSPPPDETAVPWATGQIQSRWVGSACPTETVASGALGYPNQQPGQTEAKLPL